MKDAVKQRGNSRRLATSASWKPGQSGNPAGRPRTGNALAEVLRDFLDEPLKTGNRKRKLIECLYKMATGGDSSSVPALRLLIETVRQDDVEVRLARLEEALARDEHRGRS